MKKKGAECIRIDPQEQLCPAFDSTGIKLSGLPEPEMGVAVLDDFPEEHIQ